MSLNFWIGKTIDTVQRNILLLRPPIIWSRFPRGHVAECDLARFTGQRPMLTILDVGANIGQTAENYCKWFSEATVHSFEPVTSNYEKLAKCASRNCRIVANRAASGQVSGEQFIRFQNHPGLHSLAQFANASEGQEAECGEMVPVTTVDDYCSKKGIEGIDVLKSDTEGYDMEVLRGADRMLSDGRTRFVYVEAGLNHQPNQTPFCELSSTLFNKGFVLSGMYEDMRGGAQKEILWFCNALFIHRHAMETSGWGV